MTKAHHSPVRDIFSECVRPNVSEAKMPSPSCYESEGLPDEVQVVLCNLAKTWADVRDVDRLTLTQLKGAMTNHIFECRWPGGDRRVLLRFYGEGIDILFKREDEIATFEHVSRMGQGPRLLGRFRNGRIEEFIHARTLSARDLRNPSISGGIAAKLWEFHRMDMPGSKEAMLWKRMRDWVLKAARLSGSNVDFRSLEKEMTELESKISKPKDTIGFCHNDLQYGNIMLNDEEGSLTIIDYEYASYNPVAFDIANHFCEMAADYHTDVPHLLDFSKYPDSAERIRFITTYLKASGNAVNQSDIQELTRQVDRYELASHLHWGLWGTISAAISDIDFDYMEYAKQRFQRYYERKPELLR